MRFDIYIPLFNICIEFDGKQHYEINNNFGGENEFEKIKLRDNIKTQYCINNNMNLIRIRYDECVDEKLSNYFITH